MDDKKIHTDFNLEKEAPLLAGLEKRNPLGVPAGYFEGLDAAIMERIRAEDRAELTDNEPDRAVIPMAVSKAGQFGFMQMAAVITVLIMFGLAGYVKFGDGGQGAEFAYAWEGFTDAQIAEKMNEISDADLLAELDVIELDDEMIAEVMGNQALAGFDQSQDLLDEYWDEFSGDEYDLDGVNLDDLDLDDLL